MKSTKQIHLKKKPTNLTLLITFTMAYCTGCFIQQCNNRCYLSKYPLQEASWHLKANFKLASIKKCFYTWYCNVLFCKFYWKVCLVAMHCEKITHFDIFFKVLILYQLNALWFFFSNCVKSIHEHYFDVDFKRTLKNIYIHKVKLLALDLSLLKTEHLIII